MIGNEKGIFRREEGFRLTFKEPVQGKIKIINQETDILISNSTTIAIYDISLRGAKIQSNVEFTVPSTKVQISFEIVKEQINLAGELLWQKQDYRGFFYGMKFDDQSYSDRELLAVLKRYVNKDAKR